MERREVCDQAMPVTCGGLRAAKVTYPREGKSDTRHDHHGSREQEHPQCRDCKLQSSARRSAMFRQVRGTELREAAEAIALHRRGGLKHWV